MKTIIMLSNDGFFAHEDGSLNFGCKEDKIWLRKQIKNKWILVGYNTFNSIKNYPKLLSLPDRWIVVTTKKVNYTKLNNVMFVKKNDIKNYKIDINFGGIQTIKDFKSDRIIVNRMNKKIYIGLKFPKEIFKDYILQEIITFENYKREIWDLK